MMKTKRISLEGGGKWVQVGKTKGVSLGEGSPE